MFEKLKEISKLFIIPIAILYLFGFISISSYSAQFGIDVFDIISAKYISAGIFPFISLIIAFYISWELYKLFPLKPKGTKWKKISFPLIVTIYPVILTLAASYFLGLFFSLCNFSKLSDDKYIIFNLSFGKYDMAARLANAINLIYPSFNFIVKTCFYFSFYLIIIFLFIFLITIITNWIKKITTRFNFNKKIPTEKVLNQGSSIISEEPKQLIEKSESLFFKLLFILTNIVSIIFLLCLLWYSAVKLFINIIDLKSFNNLGTVTTGLIFAWLFTAEGFIFTFLKSHDFPHNLSDFKDFLSKKNNPSDIQNILQSFILPLMILLFIFGITIFPRVPYFVGGGQPREIELILKNTENEIIRPDTKNYLIGGNNQFIFIVSCIDSGKNQAIQINKDIVNLIVTKNSK